MIPKFPKCERFTWHNTEHLHHTSSNNWRKLNRFPITMQFYMFLHLDKCIFSIGNNKEVNNLLLPTKKYSAGNGAQVWFVQNVHACVPKRKMSNLPPALVQPTLSGPNTNTCTLTPDSRFTRGQAWTRATPSGHSSTLIPTGANPPHPGPGLPLLGDGRNGSSYYQE